VREARATSNFEAKPSGKSASKRKITEGSAPSELAEDKNKRKTQKEVEMDMTFWRKAEIFWECNMKEYPSFSLTFDLLLLGAWVK
jgi:hypothetical protein